MYSEAVASPSRSRLLLPQNPSAGASGDSRALTPLHAPSPSSSLFPSSSLSPFSFQEAKPDQEVPALPQSPLLLAGEPPSQGG